MQLFRIAQCKHIRDLSGSGGLYASGRWHNKGTRILYFSEHISLAKLEVIVNVKQIPKAICLVAVTIPEDLKIEEIHIDHLPDGWDSYPYPKAPRKLTEKWLYSGNSAILKIPSAQSHHEYNYLINPLHQDSAKIKIHSVEEIKFDQRLHL